MAITESNLQSVSRKDRHQRKVTNEWNFVYNRSRVSQKLISPKYLSQNICSIFIFSIHIYDLRNFILVITRFQNLFITQTKVYSETIYVNVYFNPIFWSAILRSHLWISLQKLCQKNAHLQICRRLKSSFCWEDFVEERFCALYFCTSWKVEQGRTERILISWLKYIVTEISKNWMSTRQNINFQLQFANKGYTSLYVTCIFPADCCQCGRLTKINIPFS